MTETLISTRLLRLSLVSYKAMWFGLAFSIQETHTEKYKSSILVSCLWDQPDCSLSHIADTSCHARSGVSLRCSFSPSLQLLVAGLLNMC